MKDNAWEKGSTLFASFTMCLLDQVPKYEVHVYMLHYYMVQPGAVEAPATFVAYVQHLLYYCLHGYLHSY